MMTVQDLWTHTDNGTIAYNMSVTAVPPHGVVALLLKDAGNIGPAAAVVSNTNSLSSNTVETGSKTSQASSSASSLLPTASKTPKLNHGAIIGIGIAVTVGIFMIIILGITMQRLRKTFKSDVSAAEALTRAVSDRNARGGSYLLLAYQSEKYSVYN
jgi:hypothetical protein